MKKFRNVLVILGIAIFTSLGLIAPSLAQTAHNTRAMSATCSNCYLVSFAGNGAKYNVTSNYWRGIVTGGATEVDIATWSGNAVIIEDLGDDEFMEYNSTQMVNGVDDSIARAHWSSSSAGNGLYYYSNVYEADQGHDSFLCSNGTTQLILESAGSASGNSACEWTN